MPPKNNLYSFEQAKRVMAQQLRSYQPSKSVVRIEIKIKPVDQLDFLSAQTADVKVFGANQDDSAAIAWVGAAVNCIGRGKVAFAAVSIDPTSGWRMTIMSLYEAKVFIVSARVSPFVAEEFDIPCSGIKPPPSRCIAATNEPNVLLDGS